MPNSIKSIYETLLNQQRIIALQCLDEKEHREVFAQCHNFLGDIEKFMAVVDGRPEAACVSSAGHEYQFALSSVLIGQYRHAFGSLRLTLELLASAIHFSGHELQLRQWENANRDLNWTALKDAENGIFSKSFISAFHPFLGDLGPQFRGLTIATYRECSEFVHGNPTRTRALEGELEFRTDVLNQWAEAVESIRLVTVFLFLARYVESSKGKSREVLEELATDNLWHEEQIRVCFEGE